MTDQNYIVIFHIQVYRKPSIYVKAILGKKQLKIAIDAPRCLCYDAPTYKIDPNINYQAILRV